MPVKFIGKRKSGGLRDGGEGLKLNRICRNADFIELNEFNVQVGETSDYIARE